MCNNSKFYICEKCGNFVSMINSSGVKMKCCGQEMTELKPNVVDASHEKHVPVVEFSDGAVKVSVGSVIHPMSEEHNIAWISLVTDKGEYRKCLSVSDAPVAEFCVKDEKPIAAYAYCNLHGLWKKDI